MLQFDAVADGVGVGTSATVNDRALNQEAVEEHDASVRRGAAARVRELVRQLDDDAWLFEVPRTSRRV